MLFALVLIFNISFYFVVANTFIDVFLEFDTVGLIPLLVMLAVAVSAYLLNNIRPKLRFLSIPMLVLCFFPIQGIGMAVIMLLPCVYMALKIIFKNFDFDARNFKNMLPLSLAAISLPLIAFISAGIEQFHFMSYFPFLFAHIVSAGCLNRLSNNAKNVYSNPKIVAANLALVLCVVLILVLISSPPVLAALWRGFSFVISNILLPATVFLVDLLNRLLRPRTAREIMVDELPSYEYTMIDLIPAYRTDAANPPLFLIILFGIFAAIMLFLFFKRLINKVKQTILKRLKSVGRNQYLEQEYEALDFDFTENLQQKEKQRFFAPRDSRLAIRFYYRKYLKLCSEKGIAPEIGDTSEDINTKNKGIFSEANINKLRQLYINARYSQHEIMREKSKEAGKLTKSIQAGNSN